MDSPDVVGARIREAREAAGLKATELSKLIDVRPHTLWRYEAGRMRSSAEVILGVAQHCGVSMEWLLTGEGDGPPAESDLRPTGTGTV